jgi:hypothetical protein
MRRVIFASFILVPGLGSGSPTLWIRGDYNLSLTDAKNN